MSALQWALLFLSVAIVVAVVVISRRDRSFSHRDADSDTDRETGPAAAEREQLDIFAASSPSEPRSLRTRTAPLFEAFEQTASAKPADQELGSVSKPRKVSTPVVPVAVSTPDPVVPAELSMESPALPEPSLEMQPPVNEAPVIASLGNPQFDEFGVGRPRRRISHSLDSPEPAEPPPPPAPERMPPWARAVADAAPAPPAANELPPVVAPPPAAPKILSLLIVERAGGLIAGTKLHTVLAAQGLTFGSKQIYHRMVRDQAVFSVASLTKPGVLLPADAASFTTPGLSVFMVLPGPVKPVTALHDLLATAQALARALNAEVYDSKKQALSSELMRAMQADVEAWARTASA